MLSASTTQELAGRLVCDPCGLDVARLREGRIVRRIGSEVPFLTLA
jgi:hypothetical protein